MIKKYCIPCFEKHATQLLETLRTPNRAKPVTASCVGDSCLRRNDMQFIIVMLANAGISFFLYPSLQRVARFIGSGDDQKSECKCLGHPPSFLQKHKKATSFERRIKKVLHSIP